MAELGRGAWMGLWPVENCTWLLGALNENHLPQTQPEVMEHSRTPGCGARVTLRQLGAAGTCTGTPRAGLSLGGGEATRLGSGRA